MSVPSRSALVLLLISNLANFIELTSKTLVFASKVLHSRLRICRPGPKLLQVGLEVPVLLFVEKRAQLARAWEFGR